MNPLFWALVSYVLNNSNSKDEASFVKVMSKFLKQLKKWLVAEEWQEVPSWSEGLFDYQRAKVGVEEYENHLDSYEELITGNSLDSLIPLAIHVRGEILVDSAPAPIYRLKNMHAVYHLYWEDGQCTEYSCRPYGAEGIDLTVPTLTKLSQVFANQFCEVLLDPGLDTFHDQVAYPFDNEKFEELLSNMLDYINDLPADKREPYENVYKRISHSFRPGVSEQIISSTALKEVRKVTTTAELEWGDSSKSGGFHD